MDLASCVFKVPRLSIAAHAKINLALAVGPAEGPALGRGGYHPICSWMTAVDVFDDLIIERLETGGGASRYVVEWAEDAVRKTVIDWPVEKDLAVRAHRFMEHLAGRELPVSMVLRKRIPVGGGLGGGSSDGAAMLAGLSLMFDEVGFDLRHIAEVCTALGSDVGFFFDATRPAGCPGPAVVSGLGERVERLKAFERPVVLFVPRFGTATGPVYKAFDAGPQRPLDGALVRGLAGMGAAAKSGALFNDLAAAACVVEPRLGEILERLRAALGVPVHVTGSGSTMFALPADRAEKARIVKQTRETCPEVAVVAASTV